MSDFKIKSKEMADWALLKIVEAEKQIKENNDYADMQSKKIESFRTDVNKEYVDTINFMEANLYAFLEESEQKSIKLINGNIGFRKRQPKWEIEDSESVIKELERMDLSTLIRTKREPNLSEIKKTFVQNGGDVINTETGEVVKGIKLRDQDDSFNYKLK